MTEEELRQLESDCDRAKTAEVYFTQEPVKKLITEIRRLTERCEDYRAECAATRAALHQLEDELSETVEQAVVGEREQCARVADELDREHSERLTRAADNEESILEAAHAGMAEEIAVRIRARGGGK